MGHFSLTWNAYKQNICSGLTGLQQNAELVDMTLAADGHHVKVHQLVMSLVSPYIKELIASANCPHPIIFLNKVSSPTLHSLLEYVYTGEVVVSKENLMDLVEAGKELRIKGLEDMNVESTSDLKPQALIAVSKERKSVSNTRPLENKSDITLNEVSADDGKPNTLKLKINKREANDDVSNEDSHMDDSVDEDLVGVSDYNEMETKRDVIEIQLDKRKSDGEKKPDVSMQYTSSTRGVVQMILNRFMFTLEYTFKHEDIRKWRCIDYRRTKCPAIVFTKRGVVVKRIAAHSHSFHDKKILHKVQENSVYTSIHAIEALGKKTSHNRNERRNRDTLDTD